MSEYLETSFYIGKHYKEGICLLTESTVAILKQNCSSYFKLKWWSIKCLTDLSGDGDELGVLF